MGLLWPSRWEYSTIWLHRRMKDVLWRSVENVRERIQRWRMGAMRSKYEKRQDTGTSICAGAQMAGKREGEKDFRKQLKVIKVIALRNEFAFFGKLLQL
ncbi:hypothetical protein Aduo_009482 [Ancylostoma duodenale]